MRKLDGMENRLSALEIATKEVVNNQRTIQAQQRKLQDSLDAPPRLAPVAAPVTAHHVATSLQTQPSYEDPRRPPTAMYPSVSSPMPMGSMVSGPAMMPPPTMHMPALVPVTHISNRGEPVDQYKADLEMAKKLQAEFDTSSSSHSSNSNSNSSHSSHSYPSQPSYSTVSPSKPAAQPSKSGQQECPICGGRVALSDLEAHVEQHFEDEEARRGPAKPGEKTLSKTEAKAGFFAKIFGKTEEEKKATST